MRFAVLSLTMVAQQNRAFDGTWVLRVGGQNIFKLTLSSKDGVVTGSLVRPAKLNIDKDGDITDIGPDQETPIVQKSNFKQGQLSLTIDGNG
jgi:hypothetical protein